MVNQTSYNKHWSDTKRYLHIGIPPTKKEKRRWICKEVTNKDFVSSHSFLPLIRRIIKTRRYRKLYQIGFPTKRDYSEKKREICYACHLDSIIYRYYSEILQKNYEHVLEKNNILSKSIVAYRQLPINEDQPEKGNKCNIEFANDAFQFIKNSAEQELFVGIYDITNFFNNLDHQLLKLAWINICDFKKYLPNDHYAVYKNCTKYSYINEIDLFNLFKDRIVCKKSQSSDQIVTRKINKFPHLYNNKKFPIAFCKKEQLKEIKKRKLIHENKKIYKNNDLVPRTVGIPQGLPISAVLANIYMLIFDELIVEYLESIGGLYRRYSDDIIIICKIEHKNIVKELLNTFIGYLMLEIQESKENEFLLTKEKYRYVCKGLKYPYKNKLEYLGFEFDGERILLKSASLSAFYSRMDKGVKRSIYYTNNINNSTQGSIFRNQLFRRFSSYGSKRKRIYKQWKNSEGKIIHKYIGRKTWGNYLAYVNRASITMNEPAIKRQLKRHLPLLRKKINSSILNKKD